ncbi:hypothetical protein [uncultured Campylobacter sp.]|jgi:hypothetical protein|uniref:hypothetical protein n=1 Tax=uncultured Campylobacter sp. TaxID=218934 RepID=UPI002609DB71|nr:hypothetical protein [uncultured Campylobacter sp.]
MTLRISAAQSKFDHSPLLNGRENFILRPQRVNFKFNRARSGWVRASSSYNGAQILSRGAKISWRPFCVEISAPFRSRYGAEYKFLRRRLVAIGALVDKF